jgi:hypothetical protein
MEWSGAPEKIAEPVKNVDRSRAASGSVAAGRIAGAISFTPHWSTSLPGSRKSSRIGSAVPGRGYAAL